MNTKTQPFLKWVGGKRSILPEIKKRVPQTVTNYYEPFLGGGAVYFGLQPQKSHLSDINRHLIDTYIAVRDEVFEVMAFLSEYQENHSNEHFFKVRETLHLEEDKAKKAAGFIYLNKTNYRGLYRENKLGEIKISPNRQFKSTHLILDSERLIRAASALQNTHINCCSFDWVPIEKDAFYYLDPPYHKTWIDYHRNGFKDSEHEQLAEYCKYINRAGSQFMLSNSDTPFVRDLYKDFLIEEVEARRRLSRTANTKVTELIIRNYS